VRTPPPAGRQSSCGCSQLPGSHIWRAARSLPVAPAAWKEVKITRPSPSGGRRRRSLQARSGGEDPPALPASVSPPPRHAPEWHRAHAAPGDERAHGIRKSLTCTLGVSSAPWKMGVQLPLLLDSVPIQGHPLTNPIGKVPQISPEPLFTCLEKEAQVASTSKCMGVPQALHPEFKSQYRHKKVHWLRARCVAQG
jgi:hypothetical protein